MKKKVFSYILIVFVALLYAFSYDIFITPNRFPPTGLTGICIMVEYIFDIDMGYLNLIINLPLAIAVYFLVSKTLAKRAMVFVISLSSFSILFDNFDFSAIAFVSDTSPILGPIMGGLISGFALNLLYKAGTHSGNIEFVSSLLHKYHPNLDFYWFTLILNIIIACCSYFVLGFRLEPVIQSLLYAVSSSVTLDTLVKRRRSAVRFEIITDHPQEISDAIFQKIHHSATLLPAKGMYKGKETNVLVCVVNNSQVALMNGIIRSFPDTFAITSVADTVMGNFKQLDKHGKQKENILDPGDIQKV